MATSFSSAKQQQVAMAKSSAPATRQDDIVPETPETQESEPMRPAAPDRDFINVEQTVRRPAKGLGAKARGPAIAGLVFMILFIGGFGTWAAMAPLAGAAIATGTINPNTQRKSIAYLEGGIVSEVLVVEGSKVKAGDVLAKFSDVKARTTLEQDALKQYQYIAQRIRLETELSYLAPPAPIDGSITPTSAEPALTFPDDMTAKAAANASFGELLDGERRQFDARWRAYISQINVYNQSIAKANVDIVGLNTQIEAILVQAGLYDQEIAIAEKLLSQNLDSQSHLLDLKRSRAQADEDAASIRIRVAADEQSIATTQLDIEGLRTKQIQDVASDLATAQGNIASYTQKLDLDQDTLDRTTVRSPVDGTVTDIQIHTIGGVVSPGATIMTVVPGNDDMIIDAQINPNDMDTIHPGLPVEVVLLAYPQRRTPIIMGTLTTISADTVTDDAGDTYFTGQVTVDPKELAAVTEDIKFSAGMQVQLKIVTEERTFLDYLIEPIIRSMNRSFVES
jgi:HlyD family type I secretion membrane fusion protein